MADNRTLTFTIAGDARRLETSLNEASTAVQRTEGHLSQIKETAKHAAEAFALFEGAHIAVDFLKDATKAAIEDEAAMGRVGLSVKNAHENWTELQGPISDALAKMSETSGFMKGDLANAFAKLEGATGNSDAALGLLNDAMNASAQTGKPLAGIAMALGKAWDGNAGALGRLGVVVPQTTEKLTAQQRATEALQIAHERFAGAVEARSETMAGKVAIFQARWEEVKVQVGEAVLPLLTDAMGLLFTAVDKVSQTVEHASEIFNAHKDTILALTGAIAAGVIVFGAYEAAVTAITAATKAWAAIQAILDAELTANPIGLVIVAVAALTAGIILLYEHSATARTIINGAFHDMQAVVEAVVGNITDQFNAAKNIISGVVNTVSSLLHGDWSGAWEGAKKTVSGLVELVNSTFAGLPGKILGAIPDIASAALRAGQSILSNILGALSGLGASIVNNIRGAINSLIDQANRALEFSVSVDTHIPGVGKQGFAVNPPDIPHLAGGGLVRARPGGTLVLAGEAGEDELVMPISRAGGFGGGITIYNTNMRADVSAPEVAQNLSYLVRRALPAV